MNKLTRLNNNVSNNTNGNQLINSNLIYSSNIYDQNFYQKMMTQKEEQKRKIKNVSDLGMTQEQLTEIIIAPIKIAKNNASEIAKVYNENCVQYSKTFVEQQLWRNRTNAPYKGILKNIDTQKQIKHSNDLIVHRVTNNDKIGLLKEYSELQDVIKNHNGELRVIFSASTESEHLKKFNYVQRFKDQDKYNPKDYNDLKNFYNQEQKRHDREQKRIDDIISRITEGNIDEQECKRLETEILSLKDKSPTKIENAIINRSKNDEQVNNNKSVSKIRIIRSKIDEQNESTNTNESINTNEIQKSNERKIRIAKKISIEQNEQSMENKPVEKPPLIQPKEENKRIRIVRKIQQ